MCSPAVSIGGQIPFLFVGVPGSFTMGCVCCGRVHDDMFWIHCQILYVWCDSFLVSCAEFEFDHMRFGGHICISSGRV